MPVNLPKSSVDEIGFPALPSSLACHHLGMQYQLERSQWLSEEAVVENQLSQISTVLRHAYRTVSFYRELFDQLGFTDRENVNLDSFRRIPILTREQVQLAGERFHSQSLPAGHGKTHAITTSGSTGRPVKLLGTGITRFFWEAFLLREHAWHDRDFSKKLGIIRWGGRHAGKAPHGSRASVWPTIDLIYKTGPSCMLNVTTPLKDQTDWLVRENPHYLLSYPSNIAALARYCLEHAIRIPGLREVRTIGEMISEQTRSLCKQAWDAKLVDLYSCEEAGYLAAQCPQHDHYHVQSENVLLEIVDEEGKPCAPHQPGRVVITSLHNFATPLIRYELGDIAEFGDPCPCGRGLPVVKKIHGRKRNRLVTPDGHTEFPYLGEHGQIQKLTGVKVLQYQLIQHSIEEVEMKLVTDRGFTAEELVKVAAHVQNNLSYPFHVKISRVEELSKGPTGKFDEFISHVSG